MTTRTFYETEKRLDLLNGLKAKYGKTIEDILAYQEEQQKKTWKTLTDMRKDSGKRREGLEKAKEKLEKFSHDLSEIRKDYSRTLTEKIVEGLRDLKLPGCEIQYQF